MSQPPILTVRSRHSRRRLARLLRGMQQMGRYPSVIVLAGTLGCIPHNSVSIKGDSVLVAVDSAGLPQVPTDKPTRLVRLDLKTMSVTEVRGLGPTCMWFVQSGDRLAYVTEGEDDKPVVVVVGGPEPVTIADAAYPDLRGDTLAYARAAGDDGESQIVIRDLKSGRETVLPGKAIAPALAPDGRHVAFVEVDDKQLALYVSKVDGEGKAAVASARMNDDAEEGLMDLIEPEWLDADRLMFSRQAEGRDDRDIAVYDLRTGTSTALIATGRDERGPTPIAGGGVLYIERQGAGGTLHLRRADGETVDLTDQAIEVESDGSRAVVLTLDPETEKSRLLLYDFTRGDQATDLTPLLVGEAGGQGGKTEP